MHRIEADVAHVTDVDYVFGVEIKNVPFQYN
jgi:hypothetical protein